MKYNAQGQEVEDNDPTAVSDVWPIPAAAPALDNTTDLLRSYQNELIRLSAENRQTRTEIDELKKPAPVTRTAEEERKFFDTPTSSVTEIVRKEVRDAIAPLNQFTANATRQANYENLKQQMKANPSFPYVTQIEHLIDQVMANVQQPDANSIVSAYNQALGFYISNGGELNRTPTPAPAAPPSREAPPVAPLPPHARVTPPANGGRTPANGKVRELSENEKKIARFNRWDDKHYLFWTEHVLPREVGKITDAEVEERIKQIFG